MARTKSPNPSLPAHLWTEYSSLPPPLRDLLSQVAHFFDQLGYTNTFNALLSEARENGITPEISGWEKGLDDGTSVTLMALWESWREHEDGFPKLPPSSPVKRQKKEAVLVPTADGQESSDASSDASSDREEDAETEGKQAGLVDDEAEDTSDDSSDEEEQEDGESDSSDDEGDAAVGSKRKRIMTPESSSEESSEDESSDASSDDSSDDEEPRPAKRAKTAASDVSSDASSSKASSDHESEAAGGVEVDGSDSSEASSESSSESESSSLDSEEAEDSSNDDSSDLDSSSASSSSASSDSESSASPPPKKKAKTSTKQPVKDDNDSSSSATLAPTSPTKATNPPENELLVPVTSLNALEGDPMSDMHPDRLKRMGPGEHQEGGLKRLPATEQNVKRMKKENVPFSRIPKDTLVDPKFASNEYVSYEYADKAYKDLSVTKGKGFTKEKNKKKRGAYRGGAIDFTPKGIKFDD